MDTRIISLRLSEKAVALAANLASKNGLSRSKLIEFLIERASLEEARWEDPAYLQKRANQHFHWKEGSS